MTIIEDLGLASRRLSVVSDFTIEAQSLAQPFDIDISLGRREKVPISGFERYFRVGLDAAREGITRAAHIGIPTAVVRFVGSVDDPDDSLHAQAESLAWLIDHVEGNIALVVDPFGLALNTDLSWGIQTASKEIDVEQTVVLIKKIAHAFGLAGAAGIVTLGRIESEVMVTRAELDAIGSAAKIYSFSQNSETSAAYIYLNTGEAPDTGQKILPGNCMEMTLRALADIWDGTDLCIVKPLENYHLTSQLRHLLRSPIERARFLTHDRITELAARSPSLQGKVESMISDAPVMSDRCRGVLIGGYAVSGTSYTLSLIESARGNAMARSRLEEIWVNHMAAADTHLGPIVDRNAVSFLSKSRLC
jgi:delta-aminolevulinic acid dehydratase/porphobilinogen synthase